MVMIYVSQDYENHSFSSTRLWRTDGVYEPFVYVIEEIKTGCKYIGSRYANYCLESDIGSSYFTSSNHVVWESGEFQVIDIFSCASNHDAIILESCLIEQNNAVFDDNYYNKANWGVGDFGVYDRTDENKKKISNSLKRYFKDNDNPFKNRSHTELAKKKISDAKKGTVVSDSTKMKIGESSKGRIPWNKGIEHSKETKKKMSDSRMGIPPWNKGKVGAYTHTDDTRRKMGESNRGKKKTLGRKWVCKGDEVKYIMESDLDEYMKQGWFLGRKDKREEYYVSSNF